MTTTIIQTVSQLNLSGSKPHFVFAPGSEGEAIFKCLITIIVYGFLCCFATSISQKWGKAASFLLGIIFVCSLGNWIVHDRHHRSEESEMLRRAPGIYSFLQSNFAQIDLNHDDRIEASELNHFKLNGPGVDTNTSQSIDYHGHLAQIKILPGNNKYIYAIDRDDLEIFRLWALNAYQNL